jgi:hypothetical protein
MRKVLFILFIFFTSANYSFSQDSLRSNVSFIGFHGAGGGTFNWHSNEYNIYDIESGELRDGSFSFIGIQSCTFYNYRFGCVMDLNYFYESLYNILPALNYSAKYPTAIDLPRFKNLSTLDYKRKIIQPAFGPVFLLSKNPDKYFYLNALICFEFNLHESETYTYRAHNYYPYAPSPYFDPYSITFSNSHFYLDNTLLAVGFGGYCQFIKKVIYFNYESILYFMPFYRAHKSHEDLYNSKLSFSLGFSYKF